MILYEVKNRIAYIIFNRPEKRNAFNAEFAEKLHAALLRAEHDSEVKVIVLKANGAVFSAGADLGALQQLQQNTREQNVTDSTNLMQLYQYIYRHPKVIIAQVQGHAIAGGCGLATLADFSFAVPEAQFGYTEVKIGFIPAIVMVFLLRKIGEGRAKELLLTGKLISAQQAHDFGIINFIVSADKLEDEVYEFAQKLCTETSTDSLRFTKAMIATIQEMPLETALTHAANQNALARETPDCKRGIAAFLNKEKIVW